MASIGERLRQAREQAGLTLTDVAARTRIQRWILEDIERDDLSRVPGGIFVRGYLTSFARVVGVEADPLLADYRAAMQAIEPAVAVERKTVPIVSRWTMVRLAAIVLVAAVIWINMPQKESVTETDTTTAPSDTAPRAAAPAAEVVSVAATAGSTAQPVAAVDTHPNERKPSRLVVQVRATGECWIDASADGKQRAYRLLMPGEELRLEGANEVRMLVGDAGAVSYSINGTAGRALGPRGVVRKIVVPATGYESLLQQTAR